MSIIHELFKKEDPSSTGDENKELCRVKVQISTHNGRVRPNNEDNFSINGSGKKIEDNTAHLRKTFDGTSLLLEVCDGMGGEDSGEVASDIAIKKSSELFNALKNADEAHITEEVNKYVNAANTEICRTLNNSDSRRGGSTFAMVYIRNGKVFPYSLGDSRIYLYSDGVLKQISADHTLAMRKYKANIYTLEEAEHSPDSHKLTLFLGVDVNGNGLNAEVYQPFTLNKGSKLLLCSDGLYDMCEKEEIVRILSDDEQDNSKSLVIAALNRGGIDNVTCMVAEIV